MTSKRSVARLKGSWGRAEVGLAEVAELADFGLDGPVFADVVEVADDEAGGKSAIDLDAVIAAGLGALDNFSGEVGAFDAEVPADEHGEMLAHAAWRG